MSAPFKERFRAAFVETARARIERARRRLDAQGGAEEVAGELHTLAGEAAMLTFGEVDEVARRGEAVARRWAATSDPSQREECARLLAQLADLVAALSSPAGGG